MVNTVVLNQFCSLNHLIFVETMRRDNQDGCLFKDFNGEVIFVPQEKVQIADNVPTVIP